MARRFPFLFALCVGALVFTGVTLIAFGRVQDDRYLYTKMEGLKAFVAGNYADAERYFSETLKIARATRPGSRDLALDLNSLAEVYRIHRRMAEAQSLYEEALSILRRILEASDRMQMFWRTWAPCCFRKGNTVTLS